MNPPSAVDVNLSPTTVDGHHGVTRPLIARITTLLAKVVARHVQVYPELTRISAAFGELADHMESQMTREERVLLPNIAAMATSQGMLPESPSGPLHNPVQTMMQEHERIVQLLAEISSASGNFVPPPDACRNHRAVFAALAELRLDLLRRMSLENNVLYPRAVAVEDPPIRTPRDSVEGRDD